MTIIAGVVGWPVAHSRSPLLHRHWIHRAGVNAVYLPFATRPAQFETAIRGLNALGVAGVNVTIPHKEQALALADAASSTAEAIGAANMLTFSPDGTIYADNSDAFGFIAHLQSTVFDQLATLAPALIIGAGGVARAVVYALVEAGISDVLIVNRTTARAEALAECYAGVRAIPADALSDTMVKARLVINATPIGLGRDDNTPIDVAALRADAIVYDTVYSPLKTAFLRAACGRGLAAVDGLGMLMHQARAGAKAWYGVDLQPDATLRDLLEASLKTE